MLTVFTTSIPQRFVKPAFQNISDWLFNILSKKLRSANEDLRQKLKKQKQILYENAETVIKISCNWVGGKGQYAQPLAPFIHSLALTYCALCCAHSFPRSLTHLLSCLSAQSIGHSLAYRTAIFLCPIFDLSWTTARGKRVMQVKRAGIEGGRKT